MCKKQCRGVRLIAGYLAFVILFLFTVGVLTLLFHWLCKGISFSGLQFTSADATQSKRIVVLDAGHGGEDGGAVGRSASGDVYEKDLNLNIAQSLRDLLESDGITVIMTRNEDVLLYDRNVDFHGRKKVLDLAARLCVGSSVENALFVSIHMNAFPQTQYHGLQVYYSPNHALSQKIAADIQSTVSRHLQPDNTRKVKAAGSEIFLLDRLHCPAVLIECGFLSNPTECDALCSAEYRQKLAFLLFCSIRRFVSENTDPNKQDIPTFSQTVLQSPCDAPLPKISLSLDFLTKTRYNGDKVTASTSVAPGVGDHRKTVRVSSAQNGAYLS